MFKLKAMNGVYATSQVVAIVIILASINVLPDNPLLTLAVIALALLAILLLQKAINRNVDKEKSFLRRKQLQRKKRKSERRKALAEEIQFTELSLGVY